MSLNITERPVGNVTINVTILDCVGKLSLGTFLDFQFAVTKVIKEKKEKNAIPNVLVNLAEVSYLDSSGIGALVACRDKLKEQGGQLKLMNLRSRPAELIGITNAYPLSEVFCGNDHEKNEADALASFGATPAPAAAPMPTLER